MATSERNYVQIAPTVQIYEFVLASGTVDIVTSFRSIQAAFVNEIFDTATSGDTYAVTIDDTTGTVTVTCDNLSSTAAGYLMVVGR